MKNLFIFLIFALCIYGAKAQSSVYGVSNAGYISLQQYPAILSISDINFVTDNGDKILKGTERGAFCFRVRYFLGKKLPRGGDWLALGAIGVSLLMAILIFSTVLKNYDVGFRVNPGFVWVVLGTHISIRMGILIDNISAFMLMVVTVVSFFVHLYSFGYMKGEDRYHQFFSFLSLFSVSMLILVLADNLLLLYVGWELVGLS